MRSAQTSWAAFPEQIQIHHMPGRCLFAGAGVRYIHLNPLRAKIVDDLKGLDRYPYSGHSALMGERKREWQDTEYVLGFFGKRVSEARRNYRACVNKGVEMGRCLELVGGGLIRSLGG